MKNLIIILSLIFNINIYTCPTGGPEIYIKIKDNEYVTYKIKAVKGDNSPIFGINFDITNQFDYAEDYINVVPNFVLPCEGFDWIADATSVNDPTNPDLGYGYYYISIIRNPDIDQLEETVINFYVDLRMHWQRIINTPDIDIEIEKLPSGQFLILNSYYTFENGKEYRTLNNNDIILIWENNYGQEKDFSPFMKQIELTNDFSGNVISNTNIILVSSNNGFPLESYPIGYSFIPGELVNVWNTATYTFTVEQDILDLNGVSYEVRHWITPENIGKTKEIYIDKSSNFTHVKVYYLPTHPLTVTNNLEGGSSNNNFTLTWQNVPINYSWQFGNSFNAFKYEDNVDIYSLAIPYTFQSLGTTWWFLNWQDGNTNLTRSNIKVPNDIPTGGNFTAYYKGNLRSNTQNAISCNSQKKVAKTSDDVLHMVYESMNQIWYTKSTDNSSLTFNKYLSMFTEAS